MGNRRHPLKHRFRWFKHLNEAITGGNYYRAMADDDLVEALNLGLWRAGADRSLAFTVVRGEGGVPVAELHGLDWPWLGPPQEAFYRFAQLGDDAGAAAVVEAFRSVAPRAEHSGENRFERPTDSHESNLSVFLRREKEVRRDG